MALALASITNGDLDLADGFLSGRVELDANGAPLPRLRRVYELPDGTTDESGARLVRRRRLLLQAVRRDTSG